MATDPAGPAEPAPAADPAGPPKPAAQEPAVATAAHQPIGIASAISGAGGAVRSAAAPPPIASAVQQPAATLAPASAAPASVVSPMPSELSPPEPPRAAAAPAAATLETLNTAVVDWFDSTTNWLAGLPANPISDFLSGALLLVRRTLFNQAPTAAPSQLATNAAGSLGVVDPEGDPLTYTLASLPQFGAVQISQDGEYVYSPGPDFTGTDSFTVEAKDNGLNILNPFGNRAVAVEVRVNGEIYGGYVLRDPANPPATGLPADVIAAAKQIRTEAGSAESQITRDMIDVANTHSGRMEGLDFRLKSEQSLARKIADRVVTSGSDPLVVARSLSDVTRYTMTFATDDYAASVRETVGDLVEQGYQLRIKNYWQQGDPYQGINVAMTAPGGQKIELQFHTPESLAVKEGDLHKLYEIFRESKDNDERWRLYLEMTALTMAIPMPAYQVLEITALEFQSFEILEAGPVSTEPLIALLATV